MKKILVLAAVLVASGSFVTFAAKNKPAAEKNTNRISIVTTMFPEYDWVREILGDRQAFASVTMLLDNGADLHSYQPTVQDIAKISSADIFIYVGGESDAWVKDALKTVKNKNQKAISLIETLGDRVKAEEIVEGMEHEHHEDEEEEEELDEHVWLSLRNAKILVQAIAKAIAECDNAHAETYLANSRAYQAKLEQLDTAYSSVVRKAQRKVILFGDRFPFRYLTDDYGLTYYAAFTGCSAETEASFKTVIFLAGKVDEHEIPAVFTIEKSDKKIARTIVQSSKFKKTPVVTLDSMQSTTSKDIKNGASYLSIMTDNLSALEAALN
ncbi:MAG: metal ABC transporter substrate-binding protein [Treponema sp.]|nr:metal ABC transporter substrate-binding protein [Treponema sp.]